MAGTFLCILREQPYNLCHILDFIHLGGTGILSAKSIYPAGLQRKKNSYRVALENSGDQ